MRLFRTALSLAMAAAVFAACSDSPTAIDSADPPLATAVSDGANGGNEGFFFLPPLGSDNAPDQGFNPDLAPRIEICELESQFTDCGADPVVVAEFGPDQIEVDLDDELYQFNWKTNGRETSRLDPGKFYRIRILLGDTELGFLDIDPRRRGRPSREEGFFDFRINRTIPIKFWLGAGALCDTGDATVIECEEFTIRNDQPFVFVINDEGVPIGVEGPAGILPGGLEVLNLRIERLDLPPGECLEGLDTPVFGPCGRITTTPELTLPLNFGATVAICVDQTSPEFALVTGGQFDLLQIHRQTEDATETQILTNFPSEQICGDPPISVGGGGVLAQAMDRVIRRVEALFTPQPLYAADLGLGGLTRRFSRFQWSLPCEIVLLDGVDGQTAAPGNAVATPPAAFCVAENGQPVNDARIRFEVDGGNGSLTPPVGGFDDGNGVLTDVLASPAGIAAVGDWTLGDPGANSLRLFGTGLLGDGDTFFNHGGTPTTPEADMQASVPVGEVFIDATAEVDEGPVVDGLVIIDDGSPVGNALSLSYTEGGSFDLTVQARSFAQEVPAGVPGVDVSWSATGDGGAFAPNGGSTTSSTTDQGGFATVTFSAIGADHVVTATVDGELVATYTITNVPQALELAIPGSSPDEETGDYSATVFYRNGPVGLIVEARGADIEGEPNLLDGVPVSWTIESQNGEGPVTNGSFSPNGVVTEEETVTGESEAFGFGKAGVFFYPSGLDSFVVEATADNGSLIATFFLFPDPGNEE